MLKYKSFQQNKYNTQIKKSFRTEFEDKSIMMHSFLKIIFRIVDKEIWEDFKVIKIKENGTTKLSKTIFKYR